MPLKPTDKVADDYLEQTLKANPGVDDKLVKELKTYEDLMRKAGIDPKPEFKVQPPLGGDLFGLHLSNS